MVERARIDHRGVAVCLAERADAADHVARPPRGEVGIHLVSDGTTKPYRLKWRGASFSNLAVAGHILPGHKIADAVAILGSIDPVFGEVDR